jgi:hypothetical protein
MFVSILIFYKDIIIAEDNREKIEDNRKSDDIFTLV